jgi:hypothetical protein
VSSLLSGCATARLGSVAASGAGSAFFAAAAFGGTAANAQIARPSRSLGQPQRGPHNVAFSNVHVIDAALVSHHLTRA